MQRTIQETMRLFVCVDFFLVVAVVTEGIEDLRQCEMRQPVGDIFG